MSKNINVERLKFPSGRPVGSARKDAKKLSKIEKITLTEAQDKTASANGMDLPWDQAIEALKAEANKDVPNAPDPHASPARSPLVVISYEGVTSLEKEWFRNLPFIRELFEEVEQRGRKHNLSLNVIESQEGRKITMTLKLLGCDSEAAARVETLPMISDAFGSLARQKAPNGLYLSAVKHGIDNRKSQCATQSWLDFVDTGMSVERLAEMMGSKVINVSHHRSLSDRALFVYTGADRNNVGFKLHFLKGETERITHQLSSEAFITLRNLIPLMGAAKGAHAIQLPSDRILRELRKLGVLELGERGEVVEPPQLSQFGSEMIKGCIEIDLEISRGRVIESQSIPLR
tara:strand:- start:68047 stop:69084 length:1038 start_codon:yes stop_codon:yes gene_type:complete